MMIRPSYIFILTLLSIFFLSSCSKDETISKIDMFQMGKKVDPKLELVLPKDIESGVKCIQYGDGCLGGVEVKHRGISMIFVEYEKPEQAQAFAVTIDAYTIKNWLIDDVSGEPILEEFVEKAFQAKKVRDPTNFKI